MSNFIKVIGGIILLSLLIFPVGCSKKQSKLLNEPINVENIVDLAAKIKDENVMPREDLDMLTAGLARLSDSKDSINGKTIGQIIEMQKEFYHKSSIAGLVSNANRIQMNNSIGIKFTQKLMIDNDTTQADGVEFVLTNTSGKDILSIKGAIRIINNQNQLVKVRPVVYENINFKAGAQSKQREFWAHDNNNQFDVAMRNTKELTALWVAESITFADGKKLSAAVTPQ